MTVNNRQVRDQLTADRLQELNRITPAPSLIATRSLSVSLRSQSPKSVLRASSQPRAGGSNRRFLKGTRFSIAKLQNGVQVRKNRSEEIEDTVRPYLVRVVKAWRDAASAGREIEFWLNVESEEADIVRLEKRMEMGRGHARGSLPTTA
jgi:hypothetical protein